MAIPSSAEPPESPLVRPGERHVGDSGTLV